MVIVISIYIITTYILINRNNEDNNGEEMMTSVKGRVEAEDGTAAVIPSRDSVCGHHPQ